MDSLNDYFISAPVSTLLTCLFGVGLLCICETLGKRIVKTESPIIQSMFFFIGMMILSWIIWVMSLFNLAIVPLFKLIFWSVIICGGGILLISLSSFRDRFQLTFKKYIQQPFHNGDYFAGIIPVVLIGFLLLSLSVPTDADSLSYHLAMPVDILHGKGLWFDSLQLHFRLAGFGEMLNMLGVANGCPQLGAFLQMIAFLLVLNALAKTVPSGASAITIVMIIGIPTLFFLVPGQKHQLTGILATTLCFTQLKLGFRSRAELLIWTATLLFAMGIKYSFFLSGGVLIFLYLFKTLGDFKKQLNFIFGLLICGVLILGPQLIFKWYYFGDPLSPIFEGLKAHPDTVVVRFYEYISNYSESQLPFPFGLLLTTSPGRISTIIGFSAVALFGIPLFFKKYPAESIAIVMLVLLIFIFGQPTSRFLMEPVFWSIPLFVASGYSSGWFRYIGWISKIQLAALLPLLFFGCYILVPSLFSDQLRNNVLIQCANGYSEARWVEQVLPKDTKIAAINRSRAFLPRAYFPWEYMVFTRLKDEKESRELGEKFDQYDIDYLILPYHGYEKLKLQFADGLAFGPKTLPIARRNPFDKGTYQIAIYRLKKKNARK